MDVLNNHISLVTGAGTGLGRATAVKFAEEELMVVLVGRRRGKLVQVSEISIKRPILYNTNRCSFLEDVIKLRDQVLSRFGR